MFIRAWDVHNGMGRLLYRVIIHAFASALTGDPEMSRYNQLLMMVHIYHHGFHPIAINTNVSFCVIQMSVQAQGMRCSLVNNLQYSNQLRVNSRQIAFDILDINPGIPYSHN